MNENIKLSDHCLVDHFLKDPEGVPRTKFRPGMLLGIPFLLIDRRMHFTGLRGRIWRLFGIDRSPKNPNICNV